MLRIITSIFMLLICLQAGAADESTENAAATEDLVIESESESVFKGILYKVWGKLRAFSPKTVKPRNRAAVTAGIRGTETTTSIIQPYWKDDLTEDPQFQKELGDFSKAQQLAEQGDLPAASKALADFIDQHEDSNLRPNAQFALGITFGGLGQLDSSIETLKGFIEEHPEHPLVEDAKQVISELR